MRQRRLLLNVKSVIRLSNDVPNTYHIPDNRTPPRIRILGKGKTEQKHIQHV